MTEDERFNESQKTRAQFLNALAVGFVIAGAFTAFCDQEYLLSIAMLLFALILHDGAVRSVRAMKVTEETD